MKDITVTVTIPAQKVEAAIKRASKVDAWQVELLARKVVDEALKRELKKRFKQLNLNTLPLIESIDWNKIVMEQIEA